ncbi:Eco57I restriction-modification methylase domain-containing protein [Mesorhizobium sp.]|uniref:Eco57I restriction-modification methylase domain-containing protein n=1 Tax=Mesorhizobium sp. TaxID=1871066 RepID=UPI000FE85F2A|nr:Eco57I restriction-modification methylase domain-containing protein [Mesorhizobium sp.]RWB73576.1 MAG: restriction endonuclease [Mesorhizobium sp.]
MNQQAGFTLRGRNPDVLTCIANLSNDEVFTPPEFANRMLDTLAEAWAARNGGANIWADSTVTFLDPFTKSGVFLREITTRLIAGLAAEIPDLQNRVDHILTRQMFGIGITTLTSLLARRSLYCSKHANGEHSVAKGFATDSGNIWFERTEHSWKNAKCEFCGAPRALFDREPELENHAYAFIHTNDIKARIRELFGADMQFDVIIGNPPYQMTGGAGGSSDSSIYHLFVEQALKLDARFVSMVIPSRWVAGGRGMDEFRKTMLTGGHISHLVDYTRMSTAFPGVDFEGGVGYFLYDSKYRGECEYTLFQGDNQLPTIKRDLSAQDVFVRDHFAVGILDKVIAHSEPPISDILTNREPFKLESNFRGFHNSAKENDVAIYYTDRGRRSIGYMARNSIEKNQDLIDKWKVLVPKAYGERGAIPAMVLGKPIVAGPPSVCTGSYLFFYCDSGAEANSITEYYSTKFFRFLVSLRKITQDAFRPMYSWVPQQTWNRAWTDADLYQKYGLTPAEVEYVESVIRPMEIEMGLPL